MRHRNSRSLFVVPILSVAVLLLGVVAANAQSGTNLVANGTFDTNLNKWTPAANGTAVWNAADADGLATSGSVRLDSPSGQSPFGPGISTCVSVSAGQAVTFSAKIKWLASARKGAADAVVTWVSGANCQGTATPPALQTAGNSSSAGTSTWQTLSAAGTVPAGVQSAFVALRVVVYSASGTDDPTVGLAALFDNVTLSTAASLTPTATATATSSPTQTATSAPTQTATPTQPAPSATTAVPTVAPTTPAAPSPTVVAPRPPATGSGLTADSGSTSLLLYELLAVGGLLAAGFTLTRVVRRQ